MKIVLLGDIALQGLFVTDDKQNKARFSPFTSLENNFDFLFGNLETPVYSNSEINELKIKKNGILLGTKKEVLYECLDLLNVDCVSLANNHILDYGIDGLLQTIQVLKSLGIKYTGVGTCQSDVSPVILTHQGQKIAFLAYLDKDTNPHFNENQNIYINYFDEEKIINELTLLKSQVSYIILSLHWGKDYSYYYSRKQQIIAKKFIAAGASIVMGHHPHTVQPYEIIEKSKFIFYSLGGVFFGDFKIKNRLRSLPLKAKWAYTPILDLENASYKLIFIKILKYNYIKTTNRYKTKLKKLQIQNRLILRSKTYYKIFQSLSRTCFKITKQDQ